VFAFSICAPTARSSTEADYSRLCLAEPALAAMFAAAAAQAAEACLRASALTLDDIDAIVAAPAHSRFRAALSDRTGLSESKILVAEDQGTHTASFAAAFDRAADQVRPGGRVLLVAAGAGITAGAALYRMPDRTSSRQR
jgi:3-oxoacyl-[acyl-carrier-protein] synthase III